MALKISSKCMMMGVSQFSGYDSIYLFIGMIVFMKISSKLIMMAFNNFQVIVLFVKIGIKF